MIVLDLEALFGDNRIVLEQYAGGDWVGFERADSGYYYRDTRMPKDSLSNRNRVGVQAVVSTLQRHLAELTEGPR